MIKQDDKFDWGSVAVALAWCIVIGIGVLASAGLAIGAGKVSW